MGLIDRSRLPRNNLRISERWLCLAVAASIALFAGVPAAALDYARLDLITAADLEQRLDSAAGTDHTQLLIARALLFGQQDPVLALADLEAAESRLAAADSLNRTYLETARCRCLLQLGRVVAANRSCLSAVAAGRVSRNPRALSRALGQLSNLHYDDGAVDAAVTLGEEALLNAEAAGEPNQLAKALNDLGRYARAQGRYDQSLAYLTRGLDNVDPVVDPTRYRSLTFDVGVSHADLGEYALAKNYYQQALEWTPTSASYPQELLAQRYIAEADIGLGNPRTAIESLELTVVRPELQQEPARLSQVFATLGDAYLADGLPARALARYEDGLALAAERQNVFESSSLRLGQGRALTDLGQLDSARETLEQLIAELRAQGARHLLGDALLALSAVAELQNDPAGAFSAYREAQGLHEVFLRAVADQRLAFARVRLDLDRKELALAQADRDAVIRNGVLALLAALVVIVYLGVSRRAQGQLVASQRKERDKLEQLVRERTSALQEQMLRRAEADERRLQLERRVAEDDKLRVLGQLTGGVAHDFNNLLTVVMGAAEILRLKLADDDPKNLELLDHIVKAAHSGAGITRALMSYARQQPLKLENTDLERFLRQMLPLLERSLGGAMEIEVEVNTTGKLEVLLDRDQLTTAVLNLTLNACDAQSHKGTVRILLGRHNDRMAYLTVADSGCGMTAEQRERACEPFYSTKNEEGNGLGLSMVYGFTKQIGGDLEIETELDRGTVVRMLLPLVISGGAAEETEAAPRAAEIQGGRVSLRRTVKAGV